MRITDEIWKAIPGYDGYEASNTGRIRSLNYGGTKGLVREMAQVTHNGYNKLKLRGKTVAVHRLIATTFLPEWDNSLEVDHINGIRNDNRVENLRMCTHWENNHGEGFYGAKDRQKNSGQAGKRATAKKTYQYALDGAFIKEYESLQDAERSTGIHWCEIGACCRGKQRISGGYHWSYTQHTTYIPVSLKPKGVLCYNMDGCLLKEYSATMEAVCDLNIDRNGITRCCNGRQDSYKGYRWKWVVVET